MLLTRTKMSVPIVAAARGGRWGERMMLLIFTESATKTSPARAADAPAAATKKFVHIQIVLLLARTEPFTRSLNCLHPYEYWAGNSRVRSVYRKYDGHVALALRE